MQNIQRWQQDVHTLREFRSHINDRLFIERGGLVLIEGDRHRAMGVSITPQPEALAVHIEGLLEIAKERFEQLKQNAIDYEMVTQFRQEVKILKGRISDLQFTFRRHDYNNRIYAIRYNELFNTVTPFYKTVDEYKKQLIKPELSSRPKKPVEYNARTDLGSIGAFASKRAQIDDIVNAAKEALRLSNPKGKRVPRSPSEKTAREVGKIALWTPAFLAAILIEVPKRIVWNPIEQSILGEQRTESPCQKIFRILSDESVVHRAAFQNYTNQLLRLPIITDEAADAFCELAPNSQELDLERALLGSSNLIDLLPYITPEAFPLNAFLAKAQEWLNNSGHSSIFFEDVARGYNNYNQEEMLRITVTYQPHTINPHISPGNLIKILEAAAHSANCKKIILSKHLMKLDKVQDFLNRNAYRQQPQEMRSDVHNIFIREE